MVKDTKLYDILCIDPSASDADIKKSFRKLALKYHPDKNESLEAVEQFKKINAAFEIINNPKSRQLYDFYGGEQSSQLYNLYGENHPNNRQQQKGKEKIYELNIQLEDVYHGKMKKMGLTKTVICSDCHGNGTKHASDKCTCLQCGGNGMTIIQQMFGRLVQHMQIVCPECRGSGKNIQPKDRCLKCHGNFTVKEKKILQVHIKRGLKHKDVVRFENEGDQMPDMIPGDIVFVLNIQEHSKFKRKDIHLQTTCHIPLSTALIGGTVILKHLDNQMLSIRVSANEIRFGECKIIIGKGMPVANMFGNLYINFNIQSPDSIFFTPNIISKLKSILPWKHDQPTFLAIEEALPCDIVSPDKNFEDIVEIKKEQHQQHGQHVQCAQQ